MIPVSHRPLYIKKFKITTVVKSKQALAGLAFNTRESQILTFLWAQILLIAMVLLHDLGICKPAEPASCKTFRVDDKNVVRQVLSMWHFITKSFKSEAYVEKMEYTWLQRTTLNWYEWEEKLVLLLMNIKIYLSFISVLKCYFCQYYKCGWPILSNITTLCIHVSLLC